MEIWKYITGYEGYFQVSNLGNFRSVDRIIRCDNRAENLEWCTQSENEKHAFTVLGHSMVGKTNPKRVRCITTGIEFKSMLEAVNWLGDSSCIEGLKKAIVAKRLYHNYLFEYI